MNTADGQLDPERRRALLELVRRELRAAHALALGAGTPPFEVSRLLDERISLLCADRLLTPAALAAREAEPRNRSVHCHGDDVEDLGDDPVDLGGIGQ